MESYFRELSTGLFSKLTADEVLLLNYSGEDSDFARFNHSKVRQAGNVRQQELQMTLIDNHRQCHAEFNLTLCHPRQIFLLLLPSSMLYYT